MTTEESQGTSSGAASNGSAVKQRKKRKWDQPDESLLSMGVTMPAALPLIDVVSSAGALVPIPAHTLGVSLADPLATSYAGSGAIQAPIMQAAAVFQKLTQPKIQDELIIAREIVINDADPVVRFKLTKRQTQEEIQKCSGAVVITRGKYRPPNAVADGEKPLYLHISAGAHLKETPQRIKAVDRAAAMVEEMLKQGSQPLSTSVYLGFEADPSLNIAIRIRGPNDQYINHIMNETGATVILRGRDSGDPSCTHGEVGLRPLHLFLSSNNRKDLEAARILAENLLDTVSRDCGATRVCASTSKVYGAVPPTENLLYGAQSSESVTKLDFSSATSSTSPVISAARCSSAITAAVIPVSCGVGAQTGGLVHTGQSPANGFHSFPSLTSSASYGAYAGVYPQATPLQQVALSLTQSSPISTIIPPTASIVLPGNKPCVNTSSKTEKRPSQKRKFQELPATSKAAAVSYQGLKMSLSNKSPSDARESSSILSKELVDSQSYGMPQPSLCCDSPRRSLSQPLSRDMRQPPSHRTLSPPSLSRGILPPHEKAFTRPPPPSKSTCPPPVPKLSMSASLVKDIGEKRTARVSNSETVPDTLVKLMEYGDDDDDEDPAEAVEESCRNTTVVNSKPFWAA